MAFSSPNPAVTSQQLDGWSHYLQKAVASKDSFLNGGQSSLHRERIKGYVLGRQKTSLANSYMWMNGVIKCAHGHENTAMMTQR